MYRLVLYILIIFLLAALLFSLLGLMPINPWLIIRSTLVVLVSCVVTNFIFAKLFRVPINFESVYISALIISLVASPLLLINNLGALALIGVIAMASKYLMAINKRHLFNPAAIALVITSSTLGVSASWWIGNPVMLPLVLIGGLLIVRKIKRWDLVITFLIVSLISILVSTLLNSGDLLAVIPRTLSYSGFLFFTFVMLTEPLTTPPTKKLQILYGGLVGFFYSPPFSIGNSGFTPELALVIGNIFSFLVSHQQRLLLRLNEKNKLASDIYEFIFTPSKKLSYHPGQYLEWTLDKVRFDSRGNRRYFTLASSPTESDLRIGVKFYENMSKFKERLKNLKSSDTVLGGQLAGDFTLPKDPNQKLIFIAGGIGITPFRSMIKYLIDRQEKRDVVLFYSNKTAAEIVYKTIFEKAVPLGVKTVYVLSDQTKVPPGWSGKTGFITDQMIKDELPDYKERTFYLSGPHSLVTAFEQTLSKMGIPKNQVKTDYFPGF